jgi:hypothetical protein
LLKTVFSLIWGVRGCAISSDKRGDPIKS